MAGDTILIVGSGGREHALAWKLAGDSSRPRIVCISPKARTSKTSSITAVAANTARREPSRLRA